ncbi:MAG: T9SS type A sorting domain-containing protein [Candidatus Cloacimonetes bacterium]|nr:T9SS type A sorting domain-containing protein [Candidatus Cloacimonadota bacterium]
MKQLIIILILAFIPILLLADDDVIGIYFTFANAGITESEGDSYFEFDVMIHGDDASTKFSELQALIWYNTDAFGESILMSGNVTITAGELLDEDFYLIHKRDNMPNRLFVSCQYMGANETRASILPATPASLFHIKIKIQDNSQSSGISYCGEAPHMPGQQYYANHQTKYNPVIAIDTLDYPLSGGTVPVVLSSFTAATTVDNLVNLTWVTQTETEVQGFYIYRADDLQLDEALRISPMIDATNTSQVQVYVYKDQEIYAEGTYYYWLQVMNLDGTVDFHGPISFNFVPHGSNTPPTPLVSGINPYPNPFNPDLTISYSLQNRGPIKIQILNTKGQLITTLVEGLKESGRHTCRWNGKDQYGKACGSGLYYVKMITTDKTYNSKVVLMK